MHGCLKHCMLAILLMMTMISLSSGLNVPAEQPVPPVITKKYVGKPLNILIGKRFYILRVRYNASKPWLEKQLLYHENLVWSIIGHVQLKNKTSITPSDKAKILGKLIRRIDEYDDKLDIHYTYVEYENAVIVSTDIGFFYYMYKDGRVNALYLTFKEGLAGVIRSMIDFPASDGVNISVVYGGLTGEEANYVNRAVVKKTGNGGISVINTSTYVEYTNPRERYYVLINDVRIAFPYKIGVEATPYGPIVKYIEGFQPLMFSYGDSAESFIVDKKYVGEIADSVNNAIRINNTLTHARIADIYYAVLPHNARMEPILSLYINGTNKLVLLALESGKPRILSIVTLAGNSPPEPHDPEQNLLAEILTDVKSSNNRGNINLLWPITAAIIVALAVIVLYRKLPYHKRKL